MAGAHQLRDVKLEYSRSLHAIHFNFSWAFVPRRWTLLCDRSSSHLPDLQFQDPGFTCYIARKLPDICSLALNNKKPVTALMTKALQAFSEYHLGRLAHVQSKLN